MKAKRTPKFVHEELEMIVSKNNLNESQLDSA
jgi:hypothetical protein